MEELWFLKGGTEHEVAEGGDFPVTGFIGQITVTHVWRLWSEVDPTVLEAEPDLYQQMGSGFVFYYTDLNKAKEAQAEIGSDIDPQRVLYIEMPADTIINFRDQEALGKWGASVSGEIRDVTLRSRKYRHEPHLIFLPRLVAAIADVRGWKNTGFDLSALDVARNDFVASDELQLELVGNPGKGYWTPPTVNQERNDYAHHVPPPSYRGSRYWAQRTALWASLGEDNPDVYRPKGATVTRAGRVQPSEIATTSDTLSTCLRAYTTDWARPVYARLKLLPNPRVDAVTGAGNRLTIPVICELFKDKAEAEAAHKADLEAMGIVGDTPTPPDTSGVPATWVEVPEAWVSTITELKEKGTSASADLAKTLDVTLPELMAALK